MELSDITLRHNPIALARDMLQRATDPICTAEFYMLIYGDEDQTIHFEGCADKKKDLLWVLERMKQQLMEDISKG